MVMFNIIKIASTKNNQKQIEKAKKLLEENKL